LAFVIQYAPTLLAKVPLGRTRNGREVLAGEAMLRIALAFDAAEPPPEAGEIATKCRAMAEDVGEALGALRARGLVVTVSDGGYVPARPLERISLLDVRMAATGGAPLLPDATPGRGPVPEIFREVEDKAAIRLGEVTFRALCDRARTTGENPLSASTQAGERAPEPPPVRTIRPA
ncbi:MAG TPA: ribonuclease BN, partial [Anaeromyxobacteraceae bacterium]|nr:ribonuclease BN [Anaeromyxobacteraceae bacterium]